MSVIPWYVEITLEQRKLIYYQYEIKQEYLTREKPLAAREEGRA